jgi:RNA polymerase sigma factor FliA
MRGTPDITHQTPDEASASEDDLVRNNLPLVWYLVAEIGSKLPGHVDRDDLGSAGLMALAQAARGFDAARGVPFARFAAMRIRGAIIDELRGHDWASRLVRAKARQRATAEETLSATLGRYPTAAEIAGHLGISVDEVASLDADVHRSVLLSLQGFSDAGTLEGMLPHPDPGPEDVLLNRERDSYLVDAVAALPERLRIVVQGYYFGERPMSDIATELGVTDSRISQMRSEALAMLKDGMTAVLSPEQVVGEDRPDGCVARRKAAYYASIASTSDYRTRVSDAGMRAARGASGAA